MGRRKGIDLKALGRPPFPIEPTPENVETAKEFALAKWQERHDAMADEWMRAMGRPWSRDRPHDLSSSCKFTSVFAAVVFGGQIAGNEMHQFAVVNGRPLDLNEGASDIAGIEGAYENDPQFLWNPDHLASVESCLPRVEKWLGEYSERLFATSITSRRL